MPRGSSAATVTPSDSRRARKSREIRKPVQCSRRSCELRGQGVPLRRSLASSAACAMSQFTPKHTASMVPPSHSTGDKAATQTDPAQLFRAAPNNIEDEQAPARTAVLVKQRGVSGRF